MNPETTEQAKAGATGSSTHDGVTSARATIANVVIEHEASDTTYPMFEIRDLSNDGAFLAGWLFLELHEEITVEFEVGDETVRLRAQVDALRKGESPGMEVIFVELDDEKRALLTRICGQGDTTSS